MMFRESPFGHGARMLLSSLTVFWDVIRPLCEAGGAVSFCEIGIGGGEFTKTLLNHCAADGRCYTGIDPAVDAAFAAAHQNPRGRILRQPSLEALGELPPHDVYFIDGDHNYHTVLHELRLILRHPGRWPLIFLHDVCWPWGRRDQYCMPERIPAAARHAYSTTLGVLPGRDEPGPGGFSGATSDYPYGAANHEGGPRNGVRTAVEELLRQLPDDQWRLIVLPVVFGLGVLYAPAQTTPEAAQRLQRLADAAALLQTVLEQMETNRLALFFSYTDAAARFAGIHDEYANLNAHMRHLQADYDKLRGFTRDLQSDYDALRARYGDLLSKYDSLRTRYDELQSGYHGLMTAYDGLRTSYDGLKATYDELQSKYDALLKTYRELDAQFASLDSTFADLHRCYRELEQAYRTLEAAAMPKPP